MEVGIEEELESLGERVEGRSERELFTAIERERKLQSGSVDDDDGG